MLGSMFVTPVSAQSTTNIVIDTSNLVDPLGYPRNTQEYLNVIEFFLQGTKLYKNYTEVGTCINSLKSRLANIQYTNNAWVEPLSFGYDWEQDNVYKWPQDKAIYNLTESTSQDYAPVVFYCSMASYKALSGYNDHYQKFNGFNNFMLAGLQNFLGKVFTINRLYNNYISVITYNDVDMQWFYVGEFFFYISYFPVVDFQNQDDPNINWDGTGSSPFVQASRSSIVEMPIEQSPHGNQSIFHDEPAATSVKIDVNQDTTALVGTIATILSKVKSQNDLQDYQQVTQDEEKLVFDNSPVPITQPIHPVVGDHQSNLGIDDYIQMSVQFFYGVFEKVLIQESENYGNCTAQFTTLIIHGQQLEEHRQEGRWEPGLNSLHNILLQVDPVAKACIPIYLEVFFNSVDYGPTFNDGRRVYYNVLYRIDMIWAASFAINMGYNSLFTTHTNPDGSLKTAQDQINDSRALGNLIGTTFKMMVYSKKLAEPTVDLYYYPDKEQPLDTVTFEQLKYPTNDLTELWPDTETF